MSKKETRYNRDSRKYLVDLIENLKNDDDYTKIFDILTSDPANVWTRNSNGVFINLSVASDETLDKITKFLKKTTSNKSLEIEVDTNAIPIVSTQQKNRTYKLSNYEQNIIKQKNLKKVMDAEKEYEELTFNTNKKSKAKPVVAKKPVRKSQSKKIDL